MDADVELVRNARDGNRKAFDELIRRTTRLIYAKHFLDTGSPDLAEDLVQETFVRAYRSISRLSEPGTFRSWLLTIAHSVAVDHHRRNSREKRAEPRRVPESTLANTPAPECAPSEQLDRVRNALLALPENYRLPLTLRYLDGKDYEAISSQLGLTNGSLRGILYRGLDLLRSTLKAEVPS